MAVAYTPRPVPHPAPTSGGRRCMLVIKVMAAQQLHAGSTHAQLRRDVPWLRGLCPCRFNEIVLTIWEPSAHELTAVRRLYLLTRIRVD